MLEALMEVTIQHLGDVRFEASTRGHRVICDQPPDNGGSDTGMTPPEYLLVSLGICAPPSSPPTSIRPKETSTARTRRTRLEPTTSCSPLAITLHSSSPTRTAHPSN